MDKYPLWHKMPNDATVSDWLGTCASVARVAALKIEDVRTGNMFDPIKQLDEAEQYLKQALGELQAVRKACGKPEN